jgi:hypothetical protein
VPDLLDPTPTEIYRQVAEMTPNLSGSGSPSGTGGTSAGGSRGASSNGASSSDSGRASGGARGSAIVTGIPNAGSEG